MTDTKGEIKSGLLRFGKKLHTDVIRDIRSWENDPVLSKLYKTIDSQNDWQRFLDHYAEAMVALHLIKRGYQIVKIEAPTKNHKRADFEIAKGIETFFAHIKRLNFNENTSEELNITDTLVRKKTTANFGLSFKETPHGKDKEIFLNKAIQWQKIKNTEEDICSEKGRVLGSIKPLSSSVMVGTMQKGESTRMPKILKNAYEQFMPGDINVILLTDAWQDNKGKDDLELSLKDFWAKGKNKSSQVVIWFNFDIREAEISFHLFSREGCNIPSYVSDAFQ